MTRSISPPAPAARRRRRRRASAARAGKLDGGVPSARAGLSASPSARPRARSATTVGRHSARRVAPKGAAAAAAVRPGCPPKGDAARRHHRRSSRAAPRARRPAVRRRTQRRSPRGAVAAAGPRRRASVAGGMERGPGLAGRGAGASGTLRVSRFWRASSAVSSAMLELVQQDAGTHRRARDDEGRVGTTEDVRPDLVAELDEAPAGLPDVHEPQPRRLDGWSRLLGEGAQDQAVA